MNILYYGCNNSINDIVINKINLEYPIINNITKTYKNFKYFENNYYLTFPTINQTILLFIKSIIQTTTINNVIRKILILNLEQLDKESSAILRIIFENYNNTTSFIATTVRLSFIDKPIVSRFSIIRIPINKQDLHVYTPASNITIKPTIIEIKKLVKKCKNYKISDIVTDLLKITPYKQQFIETCSNIEYLSQYHKNKLLLIETIFLVCFYPPKYDIKTSN